MIRGVQCTGPLKNQGGFKMKYKQNQKILQLTEETLIIGIDIDKHKHVAREQQRMCEFHL